MGQQTDRILAFPDGTDNVLLNDSDSRRCCSGYVCRRPRGAFYQNETSFLTFLLTRTLRHVLSLPANSKSARIGGAAVAGDCGLALRRRGAVSLPQDRQVESGGGAEK